MDAEGAMISLIVSERRELNQIVTSWLASSTRRMPSLGNVIRRI